MAILPILTLALVGIGCALCRATGHDVHVREWVAAATIVLISAEAACLPAVLLRHSDTATVSQAALGGTVLQILLIFAVASVLWLAGVKLQPVPFVLWLLAFYWTTLIALVIGMTSTIRLATRVRES